MDLGRKMMVVRCMYNRSHPAIPRDFCESEKADTRSPVILRNRFRIHDNLVGKWIGIGGGNGGNVVFVTIDNGDDFVGSFFERFGHGTPDFEDICIR